MKQIIKLGLKWVSETEETRTPKVERNVSLPGSLSILLFKLLTTQIKEFILQEDKFRQKTTAELQASSKQMQLST